MGSTHRDAETDAEEAYVPAPVVKAIEEIAEGRTADEDDLDDALNF